MQCRRLIYVSHVARQVRYSDAENIAVAAAERNRPMGITGLLLYTPSHFLQVLEGPERAISQVVTRIERDARHAHLRVIDDRVVIEREFDAWSMRARATLVPSHTLEHLDAEGALQILREARNELG